MLIEKNFTPADIMKAETDQKNYRKYFFKLIIICVPMGFLIGFIVSLVKQVSFWTAIAIEFIMLFLIFYFIFLKKLNSFKKDLLERIKLTGEIQVKSKFEKNRQYLIGFDSTQLDDIVVPLNVYGKTNIGDILGIEITKYSQSVLNLSKNGEILMDGN